MNKSFSIVFGLTADPIHKGHEQALINGIDFLRDRGSVISKVLLVPVYFPNLIAEKKSPVATFQQRLTMCDIVAKRLSKKCDCEITASTIEKQLFEQKEKKSYSYNTIKALNLNHCLFMVSADHFEGRWPKFRKWHKWREILSLSGLLINQRPGHNVNERFINELKTLNKNVFVVNDCRQVNTSSSSLRKMACSSNQLSTDIKNYIHQNNLYGC